MKAGGNNSNKLAELSSEFFSLIPTDFGRKRPEPLRTMDAVHEKEELLKVRRSSNGQRGRERERVDERRRKEESK